MRRTVTGGAAPIAVGLLGPLEVCVGGRTIAVARPKQRALLAVLALSPGTCVSRERLVDELWGASPPESAHHALQVHVSGLRKLLGPGLLETCPGGYKLELPPSAVDAVRAAELVAAGRREGDAAALAEALALFRGEPLADVELEGPAAREAARFSDLRAEALEEQFELALAAGEGPALVGALERLVAAEPLRERPRGQLMLALYRAGRQADALAAFQAARRTFVDELGIEPSPALRDMERAILQQDATLAAAPPAAQVAPTRRRRRLILAGALGVLALAAGVLAAVFLPPGSPDAAPPARTPSEPTTKTTAHHTSFLKATVRKKVPRRVARRHAVVRHAAPATTLDRRPATTTVAPAPVTTAQTVTRATPKPPPVATHPIATTPAPTVPSPTTTAPAGPTHLVDTFDGPNTNGAVWNILFNGSGANVVQQNGKLLITISAGTKPGGAYNFVGVQYGTRSCFSGDIDMQVDYQLLEWPPASGAYVSLQAVFANAMVERFASQGSTTDVYGSIIDPRFVQVDASGASGSLRLTRVNGVVTTYYLANGAWQQIDSAPAPHPAHLHIGLSMNPGVSPTSDIQVALDNFSATASGEIPQGC